MPKTTLSCLATALFAVFSATGEAASPGELTVEPPTLHCAGFHWQITNDDNANATATIEFRETGAETWQKGLDFLRFPALEREFVAGSLFDLEPGTDYEARITLVDPDGVEGEPTRTVSFTTRTEPVKPEGGTVYHVYPPDAPGEASPKLAEDGDWRAALADPNRLEPGDRVQFHAGEYSLSPNLEKVATQPVSELEQSDLPQMPADGTVWHVYPPDYQGEYQEPNLMRYGHRKGYWAYNLLWRNKEDGSGLQPGDTILVHAGTYKVRRNDYRDKIFQAPRWGLWRIWSRGTAERPIRIKAAGDGDVIFDGNGSYGLFEVIGSGHIWFDGLTIRNTHCGIIAGRESLGTCEGLTVTNCKFEEVAMPIFNDGESKNWYIANNEGLDESYLGPWHEAFGSIAVKAQGSFEKPIVLEAAGDGDVTFQGNNGYAAFDVLAARNLWFDGLHVTNTECAILAGYLPFRSTTGLIVTHCQLTDVRNGIYDDEAKDSKLYYIADNVLEGRTTGGMNDHASPFSIYIAGRGNVVCYNSVDKFQDALNTGWDRFFNLDDGDYIASYDMHNNLLLAGPDDWIEMDNGMFNIRAYHNLMFNAGAVALSMQGGEGGPYYWIRNIAYKKNPQPFKLPRNMFAFHNLITSANAGMNMFGSNLHLRNNLFLPYPRQFKTRDFGTEMLISFQSGVPANTSDYNAYWKTPEVFSADPFGLSQGKKPTFASLDAYAEATGLEPHGLLIEDGYGILQNVPMPGTEELAPESMDFRVVKDSPTIDAGVVLPNINENYTGNAPDIGPYEQGQPLPHYGPRR